MAFEQNVTSITLLGDGTPVGQYLGVNADTDNTAILPSAGDQILGVTQSTALAGEAQAVAVGSSVTKATAGAAFAIGVELMVAATGKFITATATNYGVAVALETAAADDDIVAVVLRSGDILA